MKQCNANNDGIQCDFPVVGGGRCKYHQVGRAYDKDQPIGMKPPRPKKRRKDIMKWNKINYLKP